MDNSIIFKMVISLEIKDMENEINRYSFCLSKKQIFFKRIKTNLEKGQGTKKHRNRPLLGCLNRQNPCTCMLSIQKNIEEHIHETDDGELGVPTSDDIMLNYQTNAYHDSAAVREILNLRPIREFEMWLEKMGIMENGRLTSRAGDPTIFLK